MSQPSVPQDAVAATEKSKFKSSYRRPRLPRETKLGMAIIACLIGVFGWVLYTRLTRPDEFDAEQYVAQNPTAAGVAPQGLPVNPNATVLPVAGSQAGPMTLPAQSPATAPRFQLPDQAAAAPQAPSGGYTINADVAAATSGQPSFLPPADRAEATTSSPPTAFRLPEAGGSVVTAADNGPAMPSTNAESADPRAASQLDVNALNQFSASLQQNVTDTAGQMQGAAATTGRELQAAGGRIQDSATAAAADLRVAGTQAVGQAREAMAEATGAADVFRNGMNQVANETRATATAVTDQTRDLSAQAGQAAAQFGAGLRNQAGNQLQQYANEATANMRGATQQVQQTIGGTVDQAANQLRATTGQAINTAATSVNQAAGSTTGQVFDMAAARMAPLQSQETFSSSPAPRQLNSDQSQAQPISSQPGFNSRPTVESPIRIPTEATQPSPIAPPFSSTPQPTGLPTTQPTPVNAAPFSSSPTGGFSSAPAAIPAAVTPSSFQSPAAGGVPPAQSYQVQSGDTYYSIAERVYGNGFWNKALYEFNRRYNPGADQLQIGGNMLIPTAEVLKQIAPDLIPGNQPR